MKKFICAALAALFSSCLLSGCSSPSTSPATPSATEKKELPPTEFKAPPEIGFMAAGQFDGYKLGTVSSLVSESTIKNSLPASYVVTYENATDGLHAVTEKEIHGMVLPVLYADEEIRRTPGIGKIEQTFIEQPVCAIFLNNSDYVLPVDAALTSLKANGKAKKIALSHSPYASEEVAYTRPGEYEKAPGRVIKVGICSDENYPYNYTKDGEFVGVNVDVAYEIAAGANAELEIKQYSKDELESALKNQEVDVILSDYIYSDSLYEEGSTFDSSFLHSESYYDASLVIVAKNEFLGNSKTVLPTVIADAQQQPEEAEQVQE
ncbi:MAG: transporter substrate-binding domain-containing protein [Oscillospiraceae bacterium]|nr:transporter substrate-binding domain-containing protein [Oscillospiraceae bacterium]MBQ7118795.1 transporter substrate-binding domain-containing protein [Oscillospiraceae bacterium]